MFSDFSSDEIGFMQAKKNVNKQGTKILHDIASAYATGAFDDPQSAVMFCSLLACICEGKVQGHFDELDAQIKWSLTPEYSAELEVLRESALRTGLASGQVVKGPWA